MAVKGPPILSISMMMMRMSTTQENMKQNGIKPQIWKTLMKKIISTWPQ